MTPEQITTLRQMRADGIKDAVIMATLGLTKGALRNIAARHNMTQLAVACLMHRVRE